MNTPNHANVKPDPCEKCNVAPVLVYPRKKYPWLAKYECPSCHVSAEFPCYCGQGYTAGFAAQIWNKKFGLKSRLVFGITPILPCVGFPEGRIRIRQTNKSFTVAHVRLSGGGIRSFYVREIAGQWHPGPEIKRRIPTTGTPSTQHFHPLEKPTE